MVFAILAFIGFEASAPLGEEAKNPRRTIPLAIVGSCLAIGLFYVLLSYAWVFGEGGVGTFAATAGASGDPWREMAKVFWAGGWVLVFAAIINSIIANSNAGFNAATPRLLRDGPERHRATCARAHAPGLQDAAIRDHPEHGDRVSLVLHHGLEVGALNGFFMIATAATVVVIVVYMLVMPDRFATT